MIDIWYLCVVLPLFICTLPLVTSDERGWPLPGLFITRQTLAGGQTLQNLGPGSSHRSLVPCDQWADLIPIRRRECHDVMTHVDCTFTQIYGIWHKLQIQILVVFTKIIKECELTSLPLWMSPNYMLVVRCEDDFALSSASLQSTHHWLVVNHQFGRCPGCTPRLPCYLRCPGYDWSD